jgi:hypothetical protein
MEKHPKQPTGLLDRLNFYVRTIWKNLEKFQNKTTG